MAIKYLQDLLRHSCHIMKASNQEMGLCCPTDMRLLQVYKIWFNCYRKKMKKQFPLTAYTVEKLNCSTYRISKKLSMIYSEILLNACSL